jgi:hypothetical protein
MDSQYESVAVGEFDVVRSTQFADDFSRGVRPPKHFILKFPNLFVSPPA